MKKKQKGFNLVELMVSLSIMAMIMVLATPSYAAWVARTRIRNIAEGMNLAIAQAKGEAIKRNVLVRFELDQDSTWRIVDSSNNSVINQKTATESSTNINIQAFPSGANVLTFNAMGVLTPNVDGTDSIRQLDVSTAKFANQARALRVVIGAGGSAVVCDPSAANNRTDFCKDQ